MTISTTQMQILTAAAQHEAQLAKAPERLPAGARNAVFRSMLKNRLLGEVPAPPEHVGLGWRQDEAGAWMTLRITDAGLAAAQEGTGGALEASAPEGQQEHPGTPGGSDGPPVSPERACPLTGATDGRATLRLAAAAVVAAWEASQSLDAPLTSMRAILAGQSARAPRAADIPRRPREGTKQAAVLALLRRPEGATVAQVADATGWAPHTVRGFFAGLRIRHGIEVTVLERVRQVGPNKIGARGSYSVYQIAAVAA
jgi:hypothetical protein